MKFAQGDYEPQNFKKLGCIKKILKIMLLTFIGSFLIVPLELLDNLCKIIQLPGLIFGGPNGVIKVKNCFNRVKGYLTGLNDYQLNSLE